MEWMLWIFALIGHLGLWCVAYNRIHATAWPRSSRKFSEKIIFLIAVIPVVYVITTMVSWYRLGFSPRLGNLIESSKPFTVANVGIAYVLFCSILGLFFFLQWVWRQCSQRMPNCVVSHQHQTVDLKHQLDQELLHGWMAQSLGRLPLNEILKLQIEQMTFRLDVPQELDGLRICQLSDTHFTGQIDIAWYQEVIRRANAFAPHLIFVTGDLVDHPKCLSWLDSTFGQLESQLGVYYVLGNHDRRIVDVRDYRERLSKTGMIQAAGRWRSLKYQGCEILIAGNELPWYSGAEVLPTHPRLEPAALQILLSHSPDQIDWARPYEFDLMFAGHTHGGQIAFPLIGPVVAPSKYDVRYASGTFQIGSMLMHVSRGLAGDDPIRFNSPPELGCFTIESSRR